MLEMPGCHVTHAAIKEESYFGDVDHGAAGKTDNFGKVYKEKGDPLEGGDWLVMGKVLSMRV